MTVPHNAIVTVKGLLGLLSLNKFRTWCLTSLEPTILKRSLKVAGIVGTLLMFINHGDVILAGIVSSEHILKIFLSYLVPFLVSTYSSVAAKLNS